jgi:nucleoside-diphosphate-sugar epimerase
MPALVILGASGFLGRAVMAAGRFPMPIKAVSRKAPADGNYDRERVTWLEADLSMPSALDDVLEPDDIIVNLAYTSNAGEAVNLGLIDNIVQGCLRRRAARLIHCSTAVVVGAPKLSGVLETTPCRPSTPYGRTKLALEHRVLSAVPRGLDVGILRPTAIVGPGGQNLVKLARSLQSGVAIVNYLRASLLSVRAMHLVPARNVAAAVLHLAGLPVPLAGNIYQVSSDDDPNNNFRSVERTLSVSLGLQPRSLPLLPVPEGVLLLLLRILGRPERDVASAYDSRKLLATGFKPIDTVLNAVREFGESIRD